MEGVGVKHVLAACALCGVLFHVERARGDEPSARDTGVRLEILATAQIPAEVEGVGRVGGLSGVMTAGWLGKSGSDFLAVSDQDSNPMLFRLHIALKRDAEPEGKEGATSGGGYALTVGVDQPVHITCDATDAETLAGVRPTRPSQHSVALLVGFEKPPSVKGFKIGIPVRDLVAIECNGALPIPDEIVRHAHPNRAIESLAWVGRGEDWGSTLADDRLWAAMEAAITTDGDEATPEHGSLCRVMVFDPTLTRLERQMFYETEPAPAAGVPGTLAINSLSELCGLPDGRVLALERSFALPRGYNATLFVVDGTTEQRAGLALPVLKKRRVASLRELGLPVMGNIEGMALGPSLSTITGDGFETGRLLLMVADDNFGKDGQVGSEVVAVRLNSDR